MGFSRIISSTIASIVCVIVTIVLLIFTPYKTMRRLSTGTHWGEVLIIAGLMYPYFYFGHMLRTNEYEPHVLFMIALFGIALSIIFFYIFTRFTHSYEDISVYPFVFTWVYTLVPTYLWFAITSLLYAIVPPPRSFSFWGVSFSIVYIAFSILMLCWKIILCYLAVRFASRLAFYRIVYAFMVYGAALIPYITFLYQMQYMRVPFL